MSLTHFGRLIDGARAQQRTNHNLLVLKIESVAGATLHFGGGYCAITLPTQLVGRARYGDYFVQHEDGHIALVKADTFEECLKELRGWV